MGTCDNDKALEQGKQDVIIYSWVVKKRMPSDSVSWIAT